MTETSTITAAHDYELLRASNLHLDLTRGKPSPAQLDLSNALLSLPGEGDYRDAAGTDLRNYGGTDGVPELRAIFAELLAVPADQLLALGNASLEIMHDNLVFALLHGVPGGTAPWRGSADGAGGAGNTKSIAFLCPTPGYDRHFAMCAALGIRMIPVPLKNNALDLDTVRSLVALDPSIRGMWIVPTHANPSGTTLTEAEVQQLVSMPTAASDFRLLWDNAYAVHHLSDDEPQAIDVLGLASAAGHADRPLVFASTSKITLPGNGIAFFAASPTNIAWFKKHSAFQTIGPDKINQLRHVRFLKSAAGVREHMRAQREVVGPRFALALKILEQRLTGVATWSKPTGGYFISLTVGDGVAARAIALAAEIGVALTPAGSAFPYGKDPRDCIIRIAPTFPTLDDLDRAINALCTCVLLATEQRATNQLGK